jgi:hypothetical protein
MPYITFSLSDEYDNFLKIYMGIKGHKAKSPAIEEIVETHLRQFLKENVK